MEKYKARKFRDLFKRAFPRAGQDIYSLRAIPAKLGLSTGKRLNKESIKRASLYLQILKNLGEEFSRVQAIREKAADVVDSYFKNTKQEVSMSITRWEPDSEELKLAKRLTDITALLEYLEDYWEIKVPTSTIEIMVKDQGFYDKFCVGEEDMEDVCEILGSNYRQLKENTTILLYAHEILGYDVRKNKRLEFDEFIELLMNIDKLTNLNHRSIANAIESLNRLIEETQDTELRREDYKIPYTY